MSFFRRIKTPYLDVLAVEHYLRTPFSLVQRYTSETCRIIAVWSRDVVQILRSAHVAQIAEFVVSFIPVYMVYMVNRPTSRDIKPSQSMRSISMAIHIYAPISGFHFIAGYLTRFAARKNTCIRVVEQLLAQNFCGKHVASFDAEVLP
jgi:hypothetical protein